MLALSILPLACFADSVVTIRITGGVFQDFAPSPYHLQHVLAPLLRKMGVAMELRVIRAGYVPRGAGVIELEVEPIQSALQALTLIEPGRVNEVSGIAFSSHLEARRVSERMALVCAQRLAEAGLACTVEQIWDTSALHPGAGLAVWAESSTGCRFGADRAGAVRRSSEAIGRFVATTLLEDLASSATVDRHLADQLVLFAALAHGTSRYRVPQHTDHVGSNLWLVEQFGARVAHQERDVAIEGMSFHR
jgi:RNA 3'-terminal phosphate cyclase (ATP)